MPFLLVGVGSEDAIVDRRAYLGGGRRLEVDTPGSKRAVDEDFEVAVTPGSYALTYAYGLHASDGPDAELVLEELER